MGRTHWWPNQGWKTWGCSRRSAQKSAHTRPDTLSFSQGVWGNHWALMPRTPWETNGSGLAPEVSMTHARSAERSHDDFLFDAGETNVLLPAGKQEEQPHPCDLQGSVVDGEVYALAVGPHGKDLPNIGRALRVGPRLVAPGTSGMYPALWVHIRQGLTCASMRQGIVILSTVRKWRSKIGPTDYEDRRRLVDFPLQQELDRAGEPRRSRQETGSGGDRSDSSSRISSARAPAEARRS